MNIVVVTCALVALSSSIAAAQDLEAGETSFRKCQPCHDVGPDATNKVGPKLNGLEGHKSGAIEDYEYSDANKKADIV